MDVLAPSCFRWPWLLVESMRPKSVTALISVVALAINCIAYPGTYDSLGVTFVLWSILVAPGELVGCIRN